MRHFLIETGPRGVKIKGCQNESYFGQLCGRHDCHDTFHMFSYVQDTETDCFNQFVTCKCFFYHLFPSFKAFLSATIIICVTCLLFLSQEVYLPWCTSIQLLPSLCHVPFASQKKVKTVSQHLDVMIFIVK